MTAEATETAVATIVADVAVDKLEALETVSRAVGADVRDAGTAVPRIPLADGVWAQIEIPKFGEPPPLAIDVHALAGVDEARRRARELATRLADATGWAITLMFED